MLYVIKVKKCKTKLDLAFSVKNSISHIIACNFDIFSSIFTNLGLFDKFVLKFRCQSHHLVALGYRFEDLQNWQILNKVLTKNLHSSDGPKRNQQLKTPSVYGQKSRKVKNGPNLQYFYGTFPRNCAENFA